MRLPLLCLDLSSFALVSYAQTLFGKDIIPASAFTKWVASIPKAYKGVYHFGELVWESDFISAINDGVVTAQNSFGRISEEFRKMRKGLPST